MYILYIAIRYHNVAYLGRDVTMTRERRVFRKYHVKLQLFLLPIALLILFVPSLIPVGQWSMAWYGIATSMLGSILYSLLDRFMGTDVTAVLGQQFDFNRDVYETGLQAVHLDTYAPILDRFADSHSIDIMAVSAWATFEKYGERVISAIECNGCNVRILLANPTNPAWSNEVVIDALGPGANLSSQIECTIKYVWLVIIKELEKRHINKGSIELRTYDFNPTLGIIITDGNYLMINPYRPFSHSSSSAAFDITNQRGGVLFIHYKETFDRSWDRSKVVVKKDWH
jgi:hypothetical protein